MGKPLSYARMAPTDSYRPKAAIGKASTLEQFALVGEKRLERLRGWTHLQLACTIENVVLNHHSFEMKRFLSSQPCMRVDFISSQSIFS